MADKPDNNSMDLCFKNKIFTLLNDFLSSLCFPFSSRKIVFQSGKQKIIWVKVCPKADHKLSFYNPLSLSLSLPLSLSSRKMFIQSGKHMIIIFSLFIFLFLCSLSPLSLSLSYHLPKKTSLSFSPLPLSVQSLIYFELQNILQKVQYGNFSPYQASARIHV